MATKPQIPSALDVIRPAITALVAARPGALQHINYGTGAYSHLIEGWKAQAALAVARLADGATNGRLSLASGDPLRLLAQSEYDAIPETAPTKSRGTVFVSRTVGTFPQGVIPKGTRLRRPALDGVPIPVAAADYVTDSDLVFAQGAQGPFKLDFTAVRAGAFANAPSSIFGATNPPLKCLDRLFDSNIVIGNTDTQSGGSFAAFGSDGPQDEDVRRYASSFATGQYGPNRDALVVAAMRSTGVRHIGIRFNAEEAREELYLYDQSWCSGFAVANGYLQQTIADSGFIGFGCVFGMTGGVGLLINVTLTIRLRDNSYLSDTSGIDASVRKALTNYFDNRSDFWIFKLNAIRAVVSRCDKRILRCTTAAVLDYTGTPVAEPTQASPPIHFHLANNAVSASYLGPV